jgi:UDP-GlcNAc:undecaprenyl-phosphate GlcNAc-1-phosphate transferase
MGDTGSLFIGLMLGSLAMIGSYTRYNDFAYVAPVIILGVPIFDTFLVMFIRWRRGRPVMFGSPDHFALRLRHKGWSVPAIVITSGAVTLLLGAVAFLVMYMKSEFHTFILSCALVVLGLVIAIWVGKGKMPYPNEEQAKTEQEAGD